MEFVYGNLETGEVVRTRKHVLVLDAEPEYTEFLRKVLERHGVTSPHPIVAMLAGDRVIVISGEGLRSRDREAVPVDEDLEAILRKLDELESQMSDLVQTMIDMYFPEAMEDDL